MSLRGGVSTRRDSKHGGVSRQGERRRVSGRMYVAGMAVIVDLRW